MQGLAPLLFFLGKLQEKVTPMSEQKTKLQKYSAPALEKGLDILEFLSLSDVSPTLSQLAQGIGRSKNEIFRMVIKVAHQHRLLQPSARVARSTPDGIGVHFTEISNDDIRFLHQFIADSLNLELRNKSLKRK